MACRKSHHDARSLSTARPANSRRKLLKSALLGGGAAAALYSAPERWTRPVIEAVSLPAHAQTSVVELGEGPWAGGSTQFGAMHTPTRGRNLAGRVTDFLVSPAHAAEDAFLVIPGCIAVFNICIANSGSDGEVDVRSGFDGIEQDNRTVPLDNNLKFAFSFGVYNVTGKYNPTDDQWTGSVSGPCPTEQQENQETATSTFTGERIQVASAGGRLRLAGLDDNSGQIDEPWTASPGPCFFDVR